MTTEQLEEAADMTDRKGTGWGGPRPGAGRPPGSGEDLVDLDTQVRRDQRDWLDRVKLAAGDKSRAHTVRRVLDEARRVQGLRSALVALVDRDADRAKAVEAGRPITPDASAEPAANLARWALDILDGNVDPAEES